ncbi:hypothetical protein F3J34_10655 [Klebsiella sp. Ap-873]|nr:hypothetical protein [Klebsiella sp. Ap-873]
MSRDEILYQIYYSYRLEKMFSSITGRLDKGLSFLLIILGSSVVGGFGYPVFIGLLIAGISAFKMAFHFEAASEHSKKQAAAYLKLYNTQHLIESDNDLLNSVTAIQDNDHAPWSILNYPAMVSTQIETGREQTSKLTPTEKIIAFICGATVQKRKH